MIKNKIVIPGILILLTLLILLSLGFWQLDRANEKRSIKNTITMAENHPVKLVTNIKTLNKKEHHNVLLKGHYDTDKQFIYDNQIVKGNAGYYVITPFKLNEKTAILVNRGFVPWYGKQSKWVNTKISTHPTTILVKLIKPVQRIQLKQQKINKSSTFPILIQSLDLSYLSQLTGYQIIPILARLNVKASNGFFRQWQPFYGSVNKHLGYAFQWFLMALVLSIIAIYLLIKNRL